MLQVQHNIRSNDGSIFSKYSLQRLQLQNTKTSTYIMTDTAEDLQQHAGQHNYENTR